MSSSSKERLWTKDFLLDTGIKFFSLFDLLFIDGK